MAVLRGEDGFQVRFGGLDDRRSVNVGRQARMNFLGASIAASTDGSGRDEPKHVQVRDQHGDATGGEGSFAHVVARLVVDVVDFSGLNTTCSGALGEQNRRENQLLLRRE